ncbi:MULTISPECIES: metalloregulator ArsR/SmtB family transcription factor [Marinobacter]|jgi:ArsR family transcriptional regulator|uniref:metalloregulator ArsR/SmtB family transcription factor n=1 Tax=Marinobacter TaxID=2742 RepID=UPI0007DA3EA0|nr:MULTISPECIES: metalloregulator ArsR/SmtB family transcription factor [unclassified Marinobacter]MBL3823298.1 metalloregulator ArsR/SmtB family transcription factor [Marinobacter sp. MC3]MBL3892371.1 metalloregulator ArsR/SmtB family transcription factor [Marinobacter sp. MW3]OAN88681.1 arsenate reductase [Marinobacter sp. EhN04]OAN91662.1 arsenate reductase [Marinobacter sp. EhC06]
MKRRVLFVCTANSARSLMAEALLRDMAGDRFEVASAGTEPTRPHPMALQVLEEAGISTEGLHSKQLADVQGQYWDYVITLCEKAANECGTVCQPAQQIAWDFADPVPANRHSTFALTLKEIKERIALFALVHQKETGAKPASYDPVTVFKALADDFRLAALLLIRSQDQLCVCELTEAFEAPQPKVSRHLATLRDAGLLATERRGQWIYYSLNPGIPQWLGRVLDETASHNDRLIENPLARLQAMADRPSVQCL